MSPASDRSSRNCPAGAGVDHLTVVPENHDPDAESSDECRG